MHYSIYQPKKNVELTLVLNSEKDIVECYFVSDEDTICEGDLFFCTKTNEILKCSQVGLSGVLTEEGKGYFPFVCCKKVIVKPEQIGWMWDNDVDDASSHFLTDFINEEDNTMIHYVLNENNGKCSIEIETICPNYDGKHIGKDCSCKTGFIDVPKLFEGKVIIHI